MSEAIEGPQATPETPQPVADGGHGACANCGVPLLGPHCHACGQPVKGLVRHFSSIVGDVLDSVFDLDTRIARTLGPLFARPGYITCEYFAGRRVRYVSPVRLFFFLTIVAIFAAQLGIDGTDLSINTRDDNNGIAAAMTVAEVEAQRDTALAAIAEARKAAEGAPGAVVGADLGERAVRETAETRIRQLRKAQERGEPPPAPTSDGISFANGPWDPETNPIRVEWLPAFANAWLNEQAARANKNVGRLKDDTSDYKDAALGAVPATLFVLVPVFALMLKLAYLFKRRLYMEHLIVALHSHAFLALCVLLLLLASALEDWLVPHAPPLQSFLDWSEVALVAWMPIYLLRMQKLVYGQGWIMTLLKFFVLGLCYSVLLGLATGVSMAIGLVAM